jgi:hypothetical protein
MSYRLYLGPAGAEDLRASGGGALYKEFGLFDDALQFARSLRRKDRVALLLEGDDGTRMNRREIAAAVEQTLPG